MAKAKNAVSFRLDDMVAAGLADDFDGESVDVQFGPWNYGGKLDHDVLGVRCKYRPDDPDAQGVDKEGFVTAWLSTGAELDQFMPSKDGNEPVDASGDGEELFGHYIVPVGEKKALGNSSNFADYLRALKAAGWEGDYENDLGDVERIYGRWNRVAQRKRSGGNIRSKMDEKKGGEILVLTQLKDKPKAGKSAGKSAATGGSASSASSKKSAKQDESAESEEAPVETRLELLVRKVARANGGVAKVGKVTQAIVTEFSVAKEKSKALDLLTDEDFQKNDAWEYDDDKETFTLT
jgi:hypothetical protein